MQDRTSLEGWGISNSLQILDGQQNKVGRKGMLVTSGNTTTTRIQQSIYCGSKFCSKWVFITPKRFIWVKIRRLKLHWFIIMFPTKKLQLWWYTPFGVSGSQPRYAAHGLSLMCFGEEIRIKGTTKTIWKGLKVSSSQPRYAAHHFFLVGFLEQLWILQPGTEVNTSQKLNKKM